MKLFVTGITGYLGSKLAVSLASEGHLVHALVRDLNSKTLPKHQNIIAFQGDLQNIDSIQSAMKGCSIVLHLAGYTNIRCKKIDPFYKVNVNGTGNILEAAKNLEVKKLIFTSSVSVFGPSLPGISISEKQPRMSSFNNDYELTKVMAENLVKDYNKKGLPGVILNISRIYGPGIDCYSNGINKLFNIILKNKFLLVPAKLETTANYVFIDDVIQAIKLAIEHTKGGEQYIIGGENATYQRLFKLMFSQTGMQEKIFTINYDLLKTLCSVISLSTSFTKYDNALCPRILDFLFTNRGVTCAKAQKELGYRHTSLEKGLEFTYQFIKNKDHENLISHTYYRS